MGRHKKNGRRKNGEGTLERKGNGVFLARWIVNGQKYSRSTGKTVRAEAEKILKEFVHPFQLQGDIKHIAELETKIKVIRGEIDAEENSKPALEVSRAYDKFLEEVKSKRTLSEGTERTYSYMFARLEKFVKGYRKLKIRELRDFNETMAEAFRKQLAKEVRPATYNRYIKVFRHVWRVLRKEAKLPTENPWEGETMDTMDLDTIPRRNLTAEETRKVLASVDGEWKTLMYLLTYTGMRVSDCSQLKWSDVSLESKEITVILLKGKQRNPYPVKIPLHPELDAILSQTKEDERKGFVVPECARFYSKGSITYRLKRIFEGCGIRTFGETRKGRKSCLVGAHSCRSSFISTLADAGYPLPLIQQITGHASTRMVERYYRTAKDSLVKCVNAIPSYENGGGKPKVSVVLDREVMDALKTKLFQSESLDDGLRRILSAVDSAQSQSVSGEEETAVQSERNKPTEPIEVVATYRKVS